MTATTPLTHAPTLVDRLREHAVERGDAPAFSVLDDSGTACTTLSYADLDAAACGVAAALAADNVRPGDRALLLIPESREFIEAFLGCLFGGVIAVPAYPPPTRLTRQWVDTVRAIARDCRPRAVLTTVDEPTAVQVRDAVRELAVSDWLGVGGLSGALTRAFRPTVRTGEDVAYLQYTSGSTADPKGVIVAHGALMRQEEMIRMAMAHDEHTRHVSWLPLFHDMGLIGDVLQSVYLGGHALLMSPDSFVARPSRWLRAISDHRATTSGAPDFAYRLCVRRVRDQECEGLDLSSWRVAYNGSEPVRATTLDAFTARFGPYGFDRRSWFPCYGLAEATLLVTGATTNEAPRQLNVRSASLQQGVVESDPDGQQLVGVGFGRLDRVVRIVDPETGERLGDCQVGEIWSAGSDVASGYWRRSVETEQVFRARIAGSGEGPFLRTGDLGFLSEGELFVTGRRKDLIIVGGRNHYPQDIEETVEAAHPEIRLGCVAAFSVAGAMEEKVVVFAALRTDEPADSRAAIAEKVSGAVAAEHGIRIAAVVLTGPHGVPKTSSGKPRRAACRAAYLAGDHGLE